MTHLPTPRLLFLLLLAALFWAASAVWPVVGWGVWLVVGGTAVLLWYDWQHTPQPADFTLTRQHHTKLALRSENGVDILVQNHTGLTVDIQVRDEPPREFRISHKGSMVAQLKGHGRTIFTYDVKPLHRGSYSFGNLNLRYVSLLGLFVRQTTYRTPTEARVYPNLLEIRQYERLVRRGQAAQIGVRQVRQIGESGEFEQLRDYLPDDDYRRISWKATARRGKPITVDFSPERSQNIILLIDIGRQMMVRPVGVARTNRLDLVINAVLLFSFVAVSRGDRVGLLVFGRDIHCYLPPGGGQGQFYHIVEALYDVQAQPVEPDYGRALGFLRAQRQKRSLVLLVTDPGSQEAAQSLVPELAAFHPHHLPMCVTLSDQTVLSAAQRAPYSTTAVYERAVAEQIMDERQLWLDTLQQRGVVTLDVPAYQLTAAVINKYLELKERARI